MKKTFLAALLLLSATGCMRLGAKVELDATRGTTARAVDQQILSEAVDQAFSKLKVPVYKPVEGPAAADGEAPGSPAILSGYVEVSSSMELPEPLRRYAAARANAAAASAGIGVREVRRVLERHGDGTWLQLVDEYPDTDVKVMVLITYAGVDEVHEPFELRHSERKGKVLKGRFKATVAIVPRTAMVPAWSEVVSGESRFELDEVEFYDAR